MCQISVVMEKDGAEELVLENVTSLDIAGGGIKITSLFEGSKELANTVVRHIDFMGGKVFLQAGGQG